MFFGESGFRTAKALYGDHSAFLQVKKVLQPGVPLLKQGEAPGRFLFATLPGEMSIFHCREKGRILFKNNPD
jgi:hypothetical protein